MASAILWKRARNRKAYNASKIGREVVCSPACKEARSEERGTGLGRRRGRVTVDGREGGKAKISHPSKGADNEQEEHYL
jgi:hypothetical protein